MRSHLPTPAPGTAAPGAAPARPLGRADPERTEPERRRDRRAAAVLPALALATAVLLLVSTVPHLGATPATAVSLLVGAAACSAALAAGVAGSARWRPPPVPVIAPVTAGLALLVAANAAAAAVVRPEASAPPVIELVLVAVGVLVLAPHWFAVSVVLLWVTWIVPAVLTQVVPPFSAVLGLALATVVALGGHLLRRRDAQDTDDAWEHARSVTVLDGLTGVTNRSGLVMMGEQILEAARRQGDAVHCVVIDLDGMRRVNDSLGRAGGDQVLIAVADALRSATRATDVVARWRDDEFVVVGPGQGTPAHELERRVAERLAAFPTATTWPRVDAGGAILAPWDGGTLDNLLGWAAQEMLLRRTLRRHASSVSPAPPPGDPGLGVDPTGSPGASGTH